MDKAKRRKEDTDAEKCGGGSFSQIKISAVELRKNLANPEIPIFLIKDYFLHNKDENNISNYIKAGGSISEICQLLNNMNLKIRDQTCIIFATLQRIIIKLIKESRDKSELMDDCKQLIANYMSEFQSILTSKTAVKNKTIILQLLASVATLHNSLACLILLSLTLNKEDVDALVEHFNPLDEKSLRVSFIHFLLAFLIEQTPKVINKLLAKKVWLPSIFPGLQYDSLFTVKLVLSTLKGRVIDNNDLIKTNKVYAFNTIALTHISELYNWNPKSWYDRKGGNRMPSISISEDDKMEIRILTHEILLTLCTSIKNGIVFQDSTYGTSGVQRNFCISNFLQKLGQPWEDSLKRDLLLKAIKVSPDLLKPVLNWLQPRLKSVLPNWLEILELISEVLTDIKFDLTNQDPKNYLHIVQDLIVPHQILESVTNGQLLKGTNTSEKLATIKLLLIILKRYNDVSEELLKENKEFPSFQKSVTAYLINSLPNSFDLLECLKSSYGNNEFTVVKEMIILFTLYEQICPEMVDIIRYDETVSNWVKEYISVFESSNSCDISVLLSMVRLEVIVNPLDAYQEQYLERFKYTTMGKEDTDIKLGLNILKEFLLKSGIFIGNEKELSLWMYCMEKYFDKGIGTLMAASLKWALANTNAIYKTLVEVKDYSTVESSSGLNLDDFLKLSVNDDINSLESSVDSMFNLSPLLPSVLQFLCDNDYTENDQFIIAFLVHYLHQQVSIQPYVSLLKKYNCSTVDKILPYIESWLTEPSSVSVSPFKKSVYCNASRNVLDGKKFDYETVKKTLIDMKDIELLLDECIFMACELSRLGQATPIRLEHISELIQFCLSNHKGLRVPLHHPAFLSYFHPIMDASNSDLTNLVLMVAEHSNLPLKSIAPFSHRLAFELKYGTDICYNLEDDSRLQKLLKIFKFSKSDVEDLIDYIFSMKVKYFDRNGKLSLWSTIVTYLLTDAAELNIKIKETNLQKFIKIIIKLIEKGYNISELCNTFLNYLKALNVDVSGPLLDSVKELFVAMSTAPLWHEEMCIYIHSLLDKVDYSNISLERSIMLLASLQKFKKKHKEVVSDSSLIIFNGLCERPSPKWLIDLKKIIDPLLHAETCKKTCNYVKANPKDIFTSIEALSVIKEIFKRSEETYTLYTLVTAWLNEELNKPKDSFDQAQSEEMCKTLTEILTSEDIDLSGINPVENEFIMHLLLKGLTLSSQPILDLLRYLVKHSLMKFPPSEVFELLTSHSCFLDVLLDKNASAKYSCLKLMLMLITKDNSLINAKHVPVLLSSYGATLRKMDQIILKILFIYERIGRINLSGWKPYVWGEAAIEQYSVRSKLTTVKPSPAITLDLFEKDLVLRTISAFPIDRTLNGDYEIEDGNIYDPAFYLPLFSQVVSESNLGWKLAGSGALALTLSALASSDSKVRSAAYHVLHRIYSTLEDHKDNLIWRHFIEALRGGIVNLNEAENVRLSSIITIFLARASLIMAFPDDPLYFSLHNFIFVKAHMKLNTVPAFFEMFHHTQGNHKMHQRWLLEVIRDGIKEQRDLQLVLNSLTFKFILDYHSCNLASPKNKELIEEIVAKCIEVVDEKQLLINNYSIIPWISGAKSNIINKLPQKINSQYKPLIDFVKQGLIRT